METRSLKKQVQHRIRTDRITAGILEGCAVTAVIAAFITTGYVALAALPLSILASGFRGDAAKMTDCLNHPLFYLVAIKHDLSQHGKAD
jgi:hypothetical protein